MKTFAVLLVAFVSVLFVETARADSLIYGVAMQCDSKNKVFALAPLVDTPNSPEYSVHAPPGFVKIKLGANQNFSCKLLKHVVKMTISVYEPQGRGAGQGAGVIVINKLSVGRDALIDWRTNFNWQVTNERVLTGVRVRENYVNVKSELCYSDGWDWSAPYWGLDCKPVPVPKSN